MKKFDAKEVVTTIMAYREEADNARMGRLAKNRENVDTYHLKQDWSHKKKGQSKEFLPKQAMATEQLTAFLHQGLVDLGRWFSMERKPGSTEPFLSSDQAALLLKHYLKKADFFPFMADALKTAILESIMIAKCDGQMVSTPVYFTAEGDSGQLELKRKRSTAWIPRISLVKPEDYYPDPSTDSLYELQRIELDYFKLLGLAQARPDVWDLELVKSLQGAFSGTPSDSPSVPAGTSQDSHTGSYRPRVQLIEMWGTLLDRSGNVLMENAQAVVANDTHLVMPPRQNPFWHGMSPFVVSPLLRVPQTVWHKALSDGSTAFNLAMNEQFNLMLDAAMQSVFGIRQFRPNWVDNAESVSDGVSPGHVFIANLQCPPGQKVFERVDTGSLSNEAISIYQLTNGEFQTASLTNDLRLGVLPSRTVKATEVVEASQSITGVLGGVAKLIEETFVTPVLTKTFLNVMQNARDLDSAEVEALLGKKTHEMFKALSPAKRFELTANGYDYSVFGLSETLGKMKDFRKWSTLMQTVSASPVLMDSFSKEYDVTKLVGEFVRALDVDTSRIRLDADDVSLNKQGEQELDEATTPGAGPATGANVQSQLPQAAAAATEEASAIPREEMPAEMAGEES